MFLSWLRVRFFSVRGELFYLHKLSWESFDSFVDLIARDRMLIKRSIRNQRILSPAIRIQLITRLSPILCSAIGTIACASIKLELRVFRPRVENSISDQSPRKLQEHRKLFRSLIKNRSFFRTLLSLSLSLWKIECIRIRLVLPSVRLKWPRDVRSSTNETRRLLSRRVPFIQIKNKNNVRLLHSIYPDQLDT